MIGFGWIVQALLWPTKLEAISQAMCTSFKVELLTGTHNFAVGGDTFNIALYPSTATLGAATTAYSSSGECPGTGNYTQGGQELATNIAPSAGAGTVAYTSWSANPSWATATITARGALIYNASKTNKAVAVLDFGADKTSTAGTFTITLPTNDGTTGIIRIA